MEKVDLEEFEKEISVLPGFVEDEDGTLTEVITCVSIEEIHKVSNERMPNSLTLIRKFEDGRSYTAKYYKRER